MRLLLSLSVAANSTTTRRSLAALSAPSNSSALCTRTTRSCLLLAGSAFSVPETAALGGERTARRRQRLVGAGKNLTTLPLLPPDGTVLFRLAVAVDLARVDRKVAVEAISAMLS
uniref:Uncharacterized protein n=1 Tax=Arundo donax TaxID=35708 RepID=A0A0A9E4U1_ARUDO